MGDGRSKRRNAFSSLRGLLERERILGEAEENFFGMSNDNLQISHTISVRG